MNQPIAMQDLVDQLCAEVRIASLGRRARELGDVLPRAEPERRDELLAERLRVLEERRELARAYSVQITW